ncbi:MAG: DNA-binding GntR family transcriptional regulator [Gammaproteobacteria bacterium]|jgi:DNA-binding GntR family transcriptional regulator
MSKLHQQCYEQLFEAILNRRLEPGAHLSEEKLSQIYQVSRSVIRRTLQRLFDEGIVDIRPNRGARVNSIDGETARHIFEARDIVESGIVMKLAGKLSEHDQGSLNQLCDEENVAINSGDRARGLRLSTQFHLALVKLGENPLLEQYATNLLSRSSLAIACLEKSQPAYCAHEDHPGIVHALVIGDAAKAQSLMTRHLDHIMSNLIFDDSAAEDSLEKILVGL